jgi:hypothetical protein
VKLQKIARGVLLEILKEKWVWNLGTAKNPQEPTLKYDSIRATLEDRMNDEYYDKVLFPHYWRMVRLLKCVVTDKEYTDLHFEEIEGELWFGSDCPECQNAVDQVLDRILYRYVQKHPEWIVEYPTDEEILALVTTKPSHQISLF